MTKKLSCHLGIHDWEEYHYTEYPTLRICRHCGTWSKESRKTLREVPFRYGILVMQTGEAKQDAEGDYSV